MWQMLHALKYLHALNVWHRDIKSSNVMLGRKEGHKMVKVSFSMLTFFHYKPCLLLQREIGTVHAFQLDKVPAKLLPAM